MEPKFQSSFIPKGPLVTSATSPKNIKVSEKGLVGFLSMIVFVFAVAVSLGMFAYNFYLTSSIAKMGNDLSAARTTLDPESIIELTRLDSRLNLTKGLLAKHTVMSPLFDFLEASTLQSVRFTDFSYADTDKGIALNMKGSASGYSDIALQADVLSKSKYIKNPVFSNLSLDENGSVTFTFSALLDPSIVSYNKQIESRAVSEINISPTASSTPIQPGTAVTSSSTGTSTSTRATTTVSTTTQSL